MNLRVSCIVFASAAALSLQSLAGSAVEDGTDLVVSAGADETFTYSSPWATTRGS